jgi:ElaB/YqjD/DUF883 family membrane-anchored ribosome-binding protein
VNHKTAKQEIEMSSSDVDTDIKHLRAELVQLRKDLGQLTDTLEKTARDGAVEAKERVRHTVDHLRSDADGYAQRLTREIEENPITGVMAAFGVGLVFGLLVSPRR